MKCVPQLHSKIEFIKKKKQKQGRLWGCYLKIHFQDNVLIVSGFEEFYQEYSTVFE